MGTTITAHWMLLPFMFPILSARFGPVLASEATIIAFSKSSNACFSSFWRFWRREMSYSSEDSRLCASRSYL